MTEYTASALRHASEAITDAFFERNLEKVASAGWGALIGAGIGAASKVSRMRKLRMLTPEAKAAIYKASDDAVKKQAKDPSYILSPAEAKAKREAEILHKASQNKTLSPVPGTPGASKPKQLGEYLGNKITSGKQKNPYLAAGAGDILQGAAEGGLVGGAAGGAIKAFQKRKKRQAMRTMAKTVALPAAGGLGLAAYMGGRD